VRPHRGNSSDDQQRRRCPSDDRRSATSGSPASQFGQQRLRSHTNRRHGCRNGRTAVSDRPAGQVRRWSNRKIRNRLQLEFRFRFLQHERMSARRAFAAPAQIPAIGKLQRLATLRTRNTQRSHRTRALCWRFDDGSTESDLRPPSSDFRSPAMPAAASRRRVRRGRSCGDRSAGRSPPPYRPASCSQYGRGTPPPSRPVPRRPRR